MLRLAVLSSSWFEQNRKHIFWLSFWRNFFHSPYTWKLWHFFPKILQPHKLLKERRNWFTEWADIRWSTKNNCQQVLFTPTEFHFSLLLQLASWLTSLFCFIVSIIALRFKLFLKEKTCEKMFCSRWKYFSVLLIEP